MLRRLLAQRYFPVLLCAATLLLKLMVPTGYMIANAHGRMTIVPCSGVASPPTALAMSGMHGAMPGAGSSKHHGEGGDHGKRGDHGGPEMPCGFAGLTAVALGAVDPIQLAALIAVVMLAGLLPALLPTVVRGGYVRPPLRGPPAVL